jgi:hypothetical protein
MVSPALSSILASGRAVFNARFSAARRLYPDLDPGAFSEFVATRLDELAKAVEAVRPDRVGEVTTAAYDVGLELLGEKVIGPGARCWSVSEAWRRILPKTAIHVSSAPGRLIPAICNAVWQLENMPGANPGLWIELMESFGPECPDLETLLKLGQFAAWRAGLAHFRQSALEAGSTLPDRLALAVVGARAESSWAAVRDKLRTNPWFNPAAENDASGLFRVVAQAGAFKGFGGLFSEPPIVRGAGDHFLVKSGGEFWLLTADAFGATLHRAGVEEFQNARGEEAPSDLKVKGARLAYKKDTIEFPELGEFTSFAANATTVAITSRFTHSIILAALPQNE